MDWTAIITALIAALVPTGGLTAIVTLRDKKTAAFLENTGEVIAHWKQIADDRTVRAEELKKDLDDKDRKIDELYREKDDLREKLLALTDVNQIESLLDERFRCCYRAKTLDDI